MLRIAIRELHPFCKVSMSDNSNSSQGIWDRVVDTVQMYLMSRGASKVRRIFDIRRRDACGAE